MDSSNWSENKRKGAGKRFAERVASTWSDPTFRALERRVNVATDLSVAIAESQITRHAVALKAGMKDALLSRQLSGDVNLTLDSIGRICEAIGYDFDVVLRKAQEQAARQPWEQRLNRTSLFKMVYEAGHKHTTFKSPAIDPANDKNWSVQNQFCEETEFSRQLAFA